MPLPTSSAHLLLSDPRPEMAKAGLAGVRKTDLDAAWRLQIAAAVKHVFDGTGWNLDQFAERVGRDKRQCARWFSGEDRPQFDALLAVPELRQPVLLMMAALVGDAVEIKTTIEIRRPV